MLQCIYKRKDVTIAAAIVVARNESPSNRMCYSNWNVSRFYRTVALYTVVYSYSCETVPKDGTKSTGVCFSSQRGVEAYVINSKT